MSMDGLIAKGLDDTPDGVKNPFVSWTQMTDRSWCNQIVTVLTENNPG
jgi:hypothetical protein